MVLLILAGITITYVMGDNSVFKQASDAKLKTDIAKWQEMLETAKTPIIIKGLGKFNPDKYFEYIEKQGIIEDKETDVVDNENGTYDVTTKPGYIFEVELIQSQDNPKDAKIEYIGQAGKIAPIIKRIETNATSTSITAKAIVTRLGNGTVTYYYKLKTEADSEYREITNVNSETGATVTEGIVAGTEYVIKAVAKNEAGETVDTAEITATKVFVESITLNKTEETVPIKQTVALTKTVKPDDSTNKNITWTSSNTAIATVNEDGVVKGITAGVVTITASTTDGSNKSASCKVTVKSISLNKSTLTIKEMRTETLTVTVLPSNATDKSVTWSSSNTEVATVDSRGVITGVSKGTATITVSTTDAIKATASCSVTVEESEAYWEEVAKWAEYIATHESEVNGTGTDKTAKRFAGDLSPLKVGQTFKAYYGDDLVEVEIIDFLHDELAEGERYASDTNKTKAGITFDFKKCIGRRTNEYNGNK